MCNSLLYRSTCYPPVTIAHAGSVRVSVIHRTLTLTTGAVTCVRHHSCDECVYTRGVEHTDSESVLHFWLGTKPSHFVFLCSWRDSNLGQLDIESDAIPIEPPRHPWDDTKRKIACSGDVRVHVLGLTAEECSMLLSRMWLCEMLIDNYT